MAQRTHPLQNPESSVLEVVIGDCGDASLEELAEWVESQLPALTTAAGLGPDAEACIVLTGDEEIAVLNEQYRGLAEPTDVLSFAMQEAEDAHAMPDLLGDIVVSVETASRMVGSGEHRQRVSEELGRSFDWGLRDEVLFLIVHGLLHLLGHDHAEPEEEAVMRAEEKRVFWAIRDSA